MNQSDLQLRKKGRVSSRKPNALVARWLASEGEDPAGGSAPDWTAWALGRMSAQEMIKVDGVFVDRAVLEQHFLCEARSLVAAAPPVDASRPRLALRKRLCIRAGEACLMTLPGELLH
jgi:hypothetical protein